MVELSHYWVARDYAKELVEAGTLAALKELVKRYGELATDAQDALKDATQADFDEWKRGLAFERGGVYAGDDFARKFGAVLVPFKMMALTVLSKKFLAPEGVVYRRLQEVHGENWERELLKLAKLEASDA